MNRLLSPSEHLIWLLGCDRPVNVVLSATINGAISVNRLTEAQGRRKRNYLTTVVGENFGEYIARVVTSHELNQWTRFWDLARQVKHQINQAVTEQKIYKGGSKAKSFLSTDPDRNRIRQYAKNIASADIVVTNLGRFEILVDQRGLELEKLYFTVTGFRHQPIIVAVVTVARKMCVTFRYQESVIPTMRAQRINQTAVERLLQAIELA